MFSWFSRSYQNGSAKVGLLLFCKRSYNTRTKSIVVLNPGSTSLKCSVFNACDLNLGFSASPFFKSQIKLGTQDGVQEICDFLERSRESFEDIQAIGFRTVHGGVHFKETILVTNSVVDTLRSIVPLAPLHIPPFLTTLASVCTIFPDLPYYAAFDTSFYSELPDYAKLYPLPLEMSERGIVKYGFHGLNHRYCCERLAEEIGEMPHRLITCHLGGGASVSAIKDGVCIDTSMGYTPLDGIMMTSRCGSLDPSIVLQLVREAEGDVKSVEKLLNQRSGIAGVSGLKDAGFLEIIETNDPKAELAYKMFLDRLCKAIGSYTAVLSGLDGLVFTGGIGENSAILRQHVVEQFSFLGAQLDENANKETVNHDRIISTDGSNVKVAIVYANEELMVAKDIQRLTNESFDI